MVDIHEKSEWDDILEWDPTLQERSKAMWTKRFESASTEALGSAIAALKRWRRWCDERGTEWLDPEPIDMAEYLEVASRKGPTAALSQF